MAAVSAITGSKKVNVSAGCSGGQTASVLASKLAADNDDLLGSLTLLVCVLHPQQNDIEAGSLISEHGMKLARRRAEKAGIIDRKSVVQGKSVSVRVNIGDRRITKKTRCRCE